MILLRSLISLAIIYDIVASFDFVVPFDFVALFDSICDVKTEIKYKIMFNIGRNYYIGENWPITVTVLGKLL